jgi:uncharacterized protein (UPF0332 family)
MTPEQQALINKAQRSLNAAKLLMQDGSNDFSVSRAYYAMFYVTQALLMQKNLSFSTHSGVINAFGLHFIKTQEIPIAYHRAMIAAERIRLKGDYDITDDLSAAGTQAQIEWAEKFIAIAQQLLT